jgi:hypothetical protein
MTPLETALATFVSVFVGSLLRAWWDRRQARRPARPRRERRRAVALGYQTARFAYWLAAPLRR